MNFSGIYQGQKRHSHQMYHPMHNSVSNFWTEAFQKSEMKHNFSDELFLDNIHLIPDPLKKNLADSLFSNEVPKQNRIQTEKNRQNEQKSVLNSQKVPSENMSVNPPKQTATAFGGIGNFFSGVMNVLTSVVFRTRSPNYYDCFDVDNHQGSSDWQHAKTVVQDKNGKADGRSSCDDPPNPNVSSDMNFDSRTAVSSCENKLNQVLNLLTPKQTSSPVWVRKRPKKVFVEPGSAEESFEDAFSSEDFDCLPDDTFIEYYSPFQYQCENLCESAAQKTMLSSTLADKNIEAVKDVLNKSDLDIKNDDTQQKNDFAQAQGESQLSIGKIQLEPQKAALEVSNMHLKKEYEVQKNSTPLETDKTNLDSNNSREELVSSCEDKLSRLKALLQEKRMKCRSKYEVPETTNTTPPKPIPTDKKPADKHFKNPNRRCGKRTKSKLKCRIEDDLLFANEISIGTPPSTENSPSQHNVNFGEYFDEISGRFRTLSTGSDDSFQIVFNECSNSTGRIRKSSDCDSEDSFIVFEDSPESCYVSNDVFDSDTESEVSDSGCGVTCKLAHTLTRTMTNLADDSLYMESKDEVDFGCKENCDMIENTTALKLRESFGLLLDEKKKLLRKSQPAKKVHFSAAPPQVRVMRVWAFAARQARAGNWERYALDRERFKRRIADADMALSWVLKPQHRSRVMFQRFMPWWNQLKRKELAEKKQREEEKRTEEAKRQEVTARKEEEAMKSEVGDKSEKTSNIDNTNKESANTIKEKQLNTEVVNKPMVHNEDSSTMLKENKESHRNVEFNNITVRNKHEAEIASELIIQNENAQLAKKIQDLEGNDVNNIKIISS